jgi:hypothetical protein
MSRHPRGSEGAGTTTLAALVSVEPMVGVENAVDQPEPKARSGCPRHCGGRKPRARSAIPHGGTQRNSGDIGLDVPRLGIIYSLTRR